MSGLKFADLPKDENGWPIGRYRVRLAKTNEPYQGVAFQDGIGEAQGRQLFGLRHCFVDELVIEERLDVVAPPVVAPVAPVEEPRPMQVMPPRRRRT